MGCSMMVAAAILGLSAVAPAAAAETVAGITERTGRDEPSVVT